MFTTDKIKTWAIWVGFVTLISGTVGGVFVGAWAFADYTEIRPVLKKEFNRLAMDQTEQVLELQQQQLQTVKIIAEAQYRNLLNKKKYYPQDWTQQDQNELCAWAEQLGYRNSTSGC